MLFSLHFSREKRTCKKTKHEQQILRILEVFVHKSMGWKLAQNFMNVKCLRRLHYSGNKTSDTKISEHETNQLI